MNYKKIINLYVIIIGLSGIYLHANDSRSTVVTKNSKIIALGTQLVKKQVNNVELSGFQKGIIGGIVFFNSITTTKAGDWWDDGCEEWGKAGLAIGAIAPSVLALTVLLCSYVCARRQSTQRNINADAP